MDGTSLVAIGPLWTVSFGLLVFLPGLIDESSKFLSAPMPESEAEKRRVLADMLGRKGDEIIGQEGLYKLTYAEAGEE